MFQLKSLPRSEDESAVSAATSVADKAIALREGGLYEGVTCVGEGDCPEWRELKAAVDAALATASRLLLLPEPDRVKRLIEVLLHISSDNHMVTGVPTLRSPRRSDIYDINESILRIDPTNTVALARREMDLLAPGEDPGDPSDDWRSMQELVRGVHNGTVGDVYLEPPAVWDSPDEPKLLPDGRPVALDNNVPLSEIKEEYLKSCADRLRPSSLVRYKGCLGNILGDLQCRLASDVNPRVVEAYRQRAVTVRSWTAECNRTYEVELLSTMLNWAVENYMIVSNPIPYQTFWTKKRKARRALALDEVHKIIDASPIQHRPVWRMFSCTGLRHGELAALKFQDVDYRRRVITVRSWVAKNHKEREVPLTDEMLEMIAGLEQQAENRQVVPGSKARLSREHVFVTGHNSPWSRTSLLRWFYIVCEKAGIEGAHPKGSVDIHSLYYYYSRSIEPHQPLG